MSMQSAAKYLCLIMNKQFNANIPDKDISSHGKKMADELIPDQLEVQAVAWALKEKMTKGLSEPFIESWIGDDKIPSELRQLWNSEIKNKKKPYEKLTKQGERAIELLKDMNYSWNDSDIDNRISPLSDLDVLSSDSHVEPATDSLSDIVTSRQGEEQSKLPTKLHSVNEQRSEDEQNKLSTSGYFDEESMRKEPNRVLREIEQRRGQQKFRIELLEAYGECCAMTGCDVREALEAAHIEPYCESRINHPANGLLLRSDIHTLFDLKLLSVDPDNFRIVIAQSLRNSSYENLQGKKFHLPESEQYRPDNEKLRTHFEALQSG